MEQKESKGELLYKQAKAGNVEMVRALHRDGADLEWKDKEGNTPLVMACMEANRYDVAQALIELGANVNARLPVPFFGTPLYHASKRGLENTVKLLLSSGANYDIHTPLRWARVCRFTNVVRAIESHICLFSGWMREFYGPNILDKFAPQLLSTRVWVVIVPANSTYPVPHKFELAVYDSLQHAYPRVLMALRNPNLEEPEAMHPNTSVTIVDVDIYNTKKKILKLAPSIEEGRQQLKWFCDACKGIPQPLHPQVFLRTAPSAPPLEDDESSAVEEGPMHYPLSDSTIHGDVTPASRDGGENTEEGSSGQCVICVDAPSDVICVPCGHVAGCMSCLTEIKSKGWGCPVCRAKIDLINKVYRV